jgi:hypothetical protein
MSMNVAQRSANWFNFPAEQICVARFAHTSKRSASAVWSNFESNDASRHCMRSPASDNEFSCSEGGFRKLRRLCFENYYISLPTQPKTNQIFGAVVWPRTENASAGAKETKSSLKRGNLEGRRPPRSAAGWLAGARAARPETLTASQLGRTPMLASYQANMLAILLEQRHFMGVMSSENS